MRPTISHVKPYDYSGLYIIGKNNVCDYAREHGATVLRDSKKAGDFPGVEIANFGDCKGMTRRDIVIVATGPITDFLAKGKRLKDSSARKFYVAVTRAQQSVAIAVDDPISVLDKINSADSHLKCFGFRPG